jgi:hypothetical protein
MSDTYFTLMIRFGNTEGTTFSGYQLTRDDENQFFCLRPLVYSPEKGIIYPESDDHNLDAEQLIEMSEKRLDLNGIKKTKDKNLLDMYKWILENEDSIKDYDWMPEGSRKVKDGIY